MKYSYDFHIHSALSPCAENEMTPNNIINMAEVNGLDIIAVTDHNSVQNLPSLEKCARNKSVVFIPGIEVESSEEVHISCLFADVASALDMGEFVKEHLFYVKNDEDLLGGQYIFDESDNITGREERMLLFPTTLTSREIFDAAWDLGGCAYFSHVDRSSYSVLSVLGAFPDNVDVGIAEVTDNPAGHKFSTERAELKDMTVLYCSDAHRLADISRGKNFIELPVEREVLTAHDIIDWIRGSTKG